MKNKILLAGPWIGEFGWELFCWQGYIRKISQRYDKVIIISRPTNKALYEDFCDEYISFDPKSYKTDAWKCEDSVNYIKLLRKTPHTDYLSGQFDIGYRCLSNGVSKDLKGLFKQQEFHKYNYETNLKGYDVIFHCRNKETGGDRNWSKAKWEELKNSLPKNLKIVCIGDKNAFLINGCDDLRGIKLDDLFGVMNKSKMIVGPSSGPMHLASLCGLKHLVWSSEHNRVRYEKDWNPFKTDLVFISEGDFNPKVKTIKDNIIKNL